MKMSIAAILFLFTLITGCDDGESEKQSSPSIPTVTHYKFSVLPDHSSAGSCVYFSTINPYTPRAIDYLIQHNDWQNYRINRECPNSTQTNLDLMWPIASFDILMSPCLWYCDVDNDNCSISVLEDKCNEYN